MHADERRFVLAAFTALFLGLGRTAFADPPSEAPKQPATPPASQPATQTIVPPDTDLTQEANIDTPDNGATEQPESQPPQTAQQHEDPNTFTPGARMGQQKAEEQPKRVAEEAPPGTLRKPLAGSISLTPPAGWTPAPEADEKGELAPAFDLQHTGIENARIRVYIYSNGGVSKINPLPTNAVGQDEEEEGEAEDEAIYRHGARAGKIMTFVLDDKKVTVTGEWPAENAELAMDFDALVGSIVITK